MNVFSIYTLILISFGIIVYWNVLPTRREDVLVLLSLTFLFMVAEPFEVFLMLGYIGIGFGFTKICYHNNQNILINCFIGCWLVIYIWVAGYLSFSKSSQVPILIGSSYILFRVMQILLDLKQGISSSYLPPVKYFLFSMNFLTLLSGPVQRVEDFNRELLELVNKSFKDIEHLSLFYRLSIGLVKVFLLSTIVKIEHEILLQGFLSHQTLSPVEFSLLALSYFIFLYLNFSGYMDIIISIGKLFGFTLPENFNKPFLAVSFLDFWERWHISLSSWMRDYLFTPVLTKLIRLKSGYWWGLSFGVSTYFITFLLLGVWHGSSFSFVLCGLMLALAASLSKIIQIIHNNVFTYNLEENKNIFATLYQRFLASISIAHISISIMGFWLTWDQIVQYGKSVSIFDIVSIYLITSFLALLLYCLFKVINNISNSVLCSRVSIKEITIASNLYLLLFAFFEYSGSVPKFVYQGF